MSLGPQIVVAVAGLMAIIWVNWYFLFSSAEPALAAASSGKTQRFTIEVNNSYSPATLRVQAGRPVRLDFHRVDRSSCTEEVVLPDFGIRAYLPTQQTTPIEFTPTTPGSYEFACGMGMVRGKIIVEDAGDTKQ